MSVAIAASTSTHVNPSTRGAGPDNTFDLPPDRQGANGSTLPRSVAKQIEIQGSVTDLGTGPVRTAVSGQGEIRP